MAYDLTPERVALGLDGPSVEVYALTSEMAHATAVNLAAAWAKAEGAAATDAAVKLYAFFADEAQPTWDLMDQRGPILPTASGMLRVPVTLAFRIIAAWIDTGTVKTSAVDEMIPPGPLRDQLNRKLKSVKKAA